MGGGGNPNLDYDTMLGLPNNFGETGFPVINGTTTNGYGGTMYQYQENQIVSEIDENLTKVLGKHQMQFGGRFRHDRFYYLNSRNADTTSFTTYSTGLEEPSTGATYGSWANTGLGDAGEYLGNVASASVQLQDPPTWFRDYEVDGYYEDHWHVSKNLTVDLGLRYEAHPARVTRNGVNVNYDLKAYNSTTGVHGAIVLGAPISQLISEGWTTSTIIQNMENIGVTFETPSQAGMPSALYENADLMVSPRGGWRGSHSATSGARCCEGLMAGTSCRFPRATPTLARPACHSRLPIRKTTTRPTNRRMVCRTIRCVPSARAIPIGLSGV